MKTILTSKKLARNKKEKGSVMVEYAVVFLIMGLGAMTSLTSLFQTVASSAYDSQKTMLSMTPDGASPYIP